MAAYNHAHATVFNSRVIQGYPGANKVRRLNDGPIGMVLMPIVGSALQGRFVLHLIVPDSNRVRLHKLSRHFTDSGIVDMLVEKVVRLENIDDLYDYSLRPAHIPVCIGGSGISAFHNIEKPLSKFIGIFIGHHAPGF